VQQHGCEASPKRAAGTSAGSFDRY
jgi:hypothetical protein